MKQFQNKSIQTIALEFEQKHIPYEVETAHGIEILCVGLHLNFAPQLAVCFSTAHDNRTVEVQTFEILKDVPASKHYQVIEVCNYLNATVKYLKFYLDSDDEVIAAYDFTKDDEQEDLGKNAFAIFCRIRKILQNHFHLFIQVLHDDADALTDVYEDHMS